MSARITFTPSPEIYRDLAIADQCKNVEAFSEFIALCSSDREPSSYFGMVSTQDLIAEILLNPRANNEQLAAGMKELRDRFLLDSKEAIADRMLRLEREVEEQQ